MKMQSCDVLVVGGGAAGLSAAITAAERGMNVILVEKHDKLGGSTAMSIGSFTAAGTRWQRRKGIGDRVNDFIADMAKFPGVAHDADNPELRAVLAAEAAPALKWLDRLGVPFVGPFPEPPHHVERMHNVVPDARMYIHVLERAARRAGVKIMCDTRLDAFVTDDLQQVSGARLTEKSECIGINASRAVIVSTGDFSGNQEMRARFLKPVAATSVPANPNSTGDGQRIGADAGAALHAMNITTGPKLRFKSAEPRGFLAALPRWIWLMRLMAAVAQRLPRGALRPFVKSLLVVHMQPSPKLFEAGTILVNLEGERFCDETLSPLEVARQPGAAAYLVFDETIRDRFQAQPYFVSTAPGVGYAFMRDYERARPDLFRRGSSPSELARVLGVDGAKLQNAIASTGKNLKPPFIAMGPVVSTVTVTEGGLAVNRACAVLRQDGTPIGRLYASGGVAQGGMRLSGHGLHIAWAVVSGRIAGRSSAQERPREAS